MIRLQNIELWGVQHGRIELINPGTFQAQAVSLTFEDQNNGENGEKHTIILRRPSPLSSPISRHPGLKYPEPDWGKPRHAHMFSSERGHGEIHNP